MIKKTILISIGFLFFLFPTFGQDLKFTKVSSKDLVYILNNIEKLSDFKSDNSDLFITVYSVYDPSGSAHKESCEVTNTIYVAVSEDGEAPEQNLFKLSSVYDPKFEKWIKDPKGPKFLLTYNQNGKIKTLIIQVTLRQLFIK